MTDADGVFERLEARRDGLPRVFVAEVEMARARGDDQSVVGDVAFVQNETVGCDVQVDGIGEQDLGVLLFAQQDTQRRGDFSRRQRARGDLVEQRLEEMEIPAVDECDGKVFMPERARCVEPAEATADNDGPVHLLCR